MRFFKIHSVYLLFTLISFSSFCQVTFYLPKGYQTYKNHDEKEVRCDEDFDNDGKKDLAILCVNTDQSKAYVVIYLTTRYLENGSYSWFPWELLIEHEFIYENGVLEIHEALGCCSGIVLSLKFKYYKNLKNMRLINYYTEVNFAVEKNINLLTGNYEVDGKVGRSNFDLITISNINNYLDFLDSFNGN